MYISIYIDARSYSLLFLVLLLFTLFLSSLSFVLDDTHDMWEGKKRVRVKYRELYTCS